MKTALLNNRYQILQTLGRGGFGETFLAIDTYMPSARKCVIKLLKPAVQEAQIPQWLQERFQREAAILEELGDFHPQIPRLYAYFSEGGNFYLVQEWIEGVTLTEKQQQQGNLSEEAVRAILASLLPVLDFIHTRRIVHRDVKPDNIILRASDGLPVLIDFGVMKEAIATMINPDARSAFSVALGTPGYMASEQAAGRPVYSSDLYSLGLTAIFLLTGKTPQNLETDPSTGEILWRKDAPHLHSHLVGVIERAIRFHPRDRFASAKEMLAALQTSTQIPTAATMAITPSHLSPQPKPKFNPKTVASPTAYSPADAVEPDNLWLKWILPVLLVLGVMVGAFSLGFNLFNVKERSRVTPSPANTPKSTEPQPIPTVESPTPKVRSTPKPRRITPTPKPEVTVAPTPEPEATLTPSPQATATPEPEATLTPSPQATATPEPEATVQPTPEVSPTPSPTSPAATSEPTPNPASIPIPVTPAPQPTTEDNKINTSKLPTFRTGTKEGSVIAALGRPTSKTNGYWPHSRAVLYRNFGGHRADLGYLFDTRTGRLRQTEISLSHSTGLSLMQKTLTSLLGGRTPVSAKQALEKIYQRRVNQYAFAVGNLEGVIQRHRSDRIYIGIWEADFH